MRFPLTLMAVLDVIAPASATPRIIWYEGPGLPSTRDHLGYGVVGRKFIVAGGAYWQEGAKRFATDAGYHASRYALMLFCCRVK